MKIYGYCSSKSKRQSYKRQIDTILHVFPDAIIVKELLAGKSHKAVPDALSRVIAVAKPNDKIVFYDPYTMASSVEIIPEILKRMEDKDIYWEFMHAPYFNRDFLLKHIVPLRYSQIMIQGFFVHKQDEMNYLTQKRNSLREGAELLSGRRGRPIGSGLSEEKIAEIKSALQNKGIKKDSDLYKEIGISSNTYYKYKKILKKELL